MKHLKITKGLFLALAATVFFAGGCAKNNAPQQQQNNQNQVATKPLGLIFTKWDSLKHRIVFLDSVNLKKNVTAYYTAMNAYYKSFNNTIYFTQNQFDAFNPGNWIPTVSVFNYCTTPLDAHTIMHVRAWRQYYGNPGTPTFGTNGTSPTNVDVNAYPGLRTFTSTAPAVTRKDYLKVAGTLTRVSTPANQIDFATRFDQIVGNDYVIDASILTDAVGSMPVWLNTSSGSVAPNANGVTPPPLPPTDPAFGTFVDPRTGNPKYYNYYRLDDGAGGHETRVMVQLEEP